MHRAGGRPAGALVPGAARRVPGARDQDGRGHGRGRRAAPAAAGLRGARRRPVRLLHARHPADRRGPAGGRSRRRPATRSSTPSPGNLCRCTGYTKILDAVELAALRMQGEAAGATETRQSDRFSIIGQSLPKIDAWAKVVGETKFADDLVLPRMAHGKLLRSPHPHALIKRIDTTRARALPGVYAVITGHDLPRVKFGILPVSQDEEALCVDKVRIVGDAVAAVAAVDEETAERATRADRGGVRAAPRRSCPSRTRWPIRRCAIHEYGDAAERAQGGGARVRRRGGGVRRGRPGPRGRVLLRGQHAPADGAARGGGPVGRRTAS